MTLVALLLLACSGPEVCPVEGGVSGVPAPGDANGDGHVDISDGCFVDHASLGGGVPPSCDAAGDLIANETLEVSDAFTLWAHLFAGTELRGVLVGSECPNPWSPMAGEDACGRLALGIDAPGKADGGFEATVTLRTRQLEPGPEAWSLSVVAEGCTITGATTSGTDAAHASEGGLRWTGYDRTEVVDGGAVSAVVLDWFTRASLEPRRKAYSVLSLEVDGAPCTLRLEDGLVGAGQPVENAVSVRGFRYVPELVEVEVR